MIRWEYRSEEPDNAKLNALGQEGWEAVTVVTDIQSDQYGNKFRVHWVLLKRPIYPPGTVPYMIPPLVPVPGQCLMCGGNHGGMPCPHTFPFTTGIPR
jgi:hypothetical protein